MPRPAPWAACLRLSPSVSLYVGGLGRLPRLCLRLSPFPFLSLRLPSCGWPRPAPWAACLRLSPSVSLHVGGFGRLPGLCLRVSACLPLFRGCVSPLVCLCHPSSGWPQPAPWAACLRLSPFVSLHVGLPGLSPLVSQVGACLCG